MPLTSSFISGFTIYSALRLELLSSFPLAGYDGYRKGTDGHCVTMLETRTGVDCITSNRDTSYTRTSIVGTTIQL